MKISYFFLALLNVCFTFCDSYSQQGKQLTVADPTILHYKNTYYLYGTQEADKGIPVYKSSDLVKWEAVASNNGFALQRGDAFGTTGFWAPQVFEYNKQFYMAYTANENIAIATSNKPEGPFTQVNKMALPANTKQIDPFILIDSDGKKYLYHVRLSNGNRIFAAVLKNDFSGIEDSTLTECIAGTEHWENTANTNWPVTEGPTVIKQNGKYWMFYSANDFRNINYAVGMAVSDHPLGPWKKLTDNPLLSRKQTGENGTGHGDLFRAANSSWYYVFHTHQSANKVAPRKTMLIPVKFTKTKVIFEKGKERPLNITNH
jgi:xylan 1,4-beta-xylosidase